MPTGLMGGYDNAAALAAAPFAAAGAGIKGAVDEGLKAYGEISGINQRDQALALQGQEGARSERRLSMAEQLLPGQMTQQELANKHQQQTIEAAGDQMTRDKAQREKTQAILDDIKNGKLTDPIEFSIRVGDSVIAGGRPEHTAKWLTDHEALLKTGQAAEQNRALLGTYMEAVKAQAENPKDPMVWGRAVDTMLREHPLAAANSVFFKNALDHMNKAVDSQYPATVAQGWKDYVGLRAAKPSLTPAQAWSEVEGKMDPAYHEQFGKLMPADVKSDYAAKAAGQKAGAEASAKLPAEIKLIEKRTDEQIRGDKAKQANRPPVSTAALQKLVSDSTAELGQIERRLSNPLLGDDVRAGLEADRVRAQRERQDARERLAEAVTKSEAKGETKPDTLDPKKVRAEAIGPFTTQLRQKSKSLDNSKAALDLSLKNGKISQAEYDQLLAGETKRWSAK